MRVSHYYFFFAEMLEIPQNLTQNILGDVLMSGASPGMRPAFFHDFLRNELGEFAL